METRHWALAVTGPAAILAVALCHDDGPGPRPVPVSIPSSTDPPEVESHFSVPKSEQGRVGAERSEVGAVGMESTGSPSPISHMLTGDASRFEPTVETLVRWGLTCGLDPVSIRDMWGVDASIREHWATVCAARELCDALSAYDDRQLERYRGNLHAIPLEVELGPSGFAVVAKYFDDPAEAAEAVALYSQETQDQLWGLGTGTESAPVLGTGLLERIRHSAQVDAAASYLSEHLAHIPHKPETGE